MNFAVIFPNNAIEHFDTKEEAIAEGESDGGYFEVWTSENNNLIEPVATGGEDPTQAEFEYGFNNAHALTEMMGLDTSAYLTT